MKNQIARCIVAAALVSPSVGMAAQKPVQQGVTSVSYNAPPPTLAGLYADSQAVVVVRVTNRRGMEAGDVTHRIITEVTGSIVEIIKPDAQVGPVGGDFVFRISGGDVDRGDHIERMVDPGQPPLVAGHEYLVALRWNPREMAFVPAYGPGTIFDVTDGTMKPQANTKLSSAVQGMNLRRAISQMKSAALSR